jgi:hemin uptake protein HemP
MKENDEDDEMPNPETDPIIPPETILSSALLKDAKEIWIDHNGERYRLRITRKGKLILQK